MHVVAQRRDGVNASTMSRPKSRGCDVVKRTRLIPGTSPTAASNSANDRFFLGSSAASLYEFTFCPSN